MEWDRMISLAQKQVDVRSSNIQAPGQSHRSWIALAFRFAVQASSGLLEGVWEVLGRLE